MFKRGSSNKNSSSSLGEQQSSAINLNQLKSFIEHIPAAIAIFDGSMRYVMTSRRWITDYKLEGKSIIGKSHYTIFPEIPERWKEIHRRCLAGVVERCDEDSFVRANGEVQWLCWEICPWEDKGETQGIIIFTEDITAAKLAQEVAKSNQEWTRTIIQQAMDAVVVMDPQGIIRSWNPQAEVIFGWPQEEAIGRKLSEVVIPLKYRRDHERGLAHFLSTGEAKVFNKRLEMTALHRCGREFPVELTVSPLRMGEEYHFSAFLRDITESKRSQEALRESEGRFRVMCNHAPVLIWMAGLDAQCVFFNKTWLDFTGRSMEQELGNGWAQGVHPEDLKSCVERYLSAFQKREAFLLEYRLRRFDGEYRWIQDQGVPIISSDGQFLGYIGSCIDMTEIKTSREKTLQEQKEQQNIFNTVPAMIRYKDLNSRILRANQLTADFLGLKIEEVEGKTIYNLYPHEAPQYRKDDLEVINSGQPKLDVIEQLTTAKGEKRWVKTDRLPYRDDAGKIVGLVVFSVDITELKTAEEKIKTALREKEILLREVHHRVKNNLQVVSSILDLQSDGLTDERLQKILIKNHQRVKAISMVHDLLYQSKELSRIDFGEYVHNLSRSIVQMYSAEPQNIVMKIHLKEVYLDITTAIPCGLIINELVTNSLKYALRPPEPCEISIDFEELPETSEYALTISDNGPGFGYGLDILKKKTSGMEIIKALATQLSGKISVKGEGGLTFKIVFKKPSN